MLMCAALASLSLSLSLPLLSDIDSRCACDVTGYGVSVQQLNTSDYVFLLMTSYLHDAYGTETSYFLVWFVLHARTFFIRIEETFTPSPL